MSVSQELASTWVSPVTLFQEAQCSPADSPGTQSCTSCIWGKGWRRKNVKSFSESALLLVLFCIVYLNQVFVKPQSVQLLVSEVPFSPRSLMSVMQIRMIKLSE